MALVNRPTASRSPGSLQIVNPTASSSAFAAPCSPTDRSSSAAGNSNPLQIAEWWSSEKEEALPSRGR
ncbi:unnamed protein product [Linum trigynum]|uniref:Uncharacterized protein n=1 Tax=Linum trigynum TaxID=586398 RepID=A0AAV2FJR4_9ROSI